MFYLLPSYYRTPYFGPKIAKEAGLDPFLRIHISGNGFTGTFFITINVRMRVGWLKGIIRRHCGMTADAFQPVLGIQTAF